MFVYNGYVLQKTDNSDFKLQFNYVYSCKKLNFQQVNFTGNQIFHNFTFIFSSIRVIYECPMFINVL